MDEQHDNARETRENRRDGEHGSRDRLNDPRTKEGHFARQHHDPGNSVDDALRGIEQQGQQNADRIAGERATLASQSRQPGESAEDQRQRLDDHERRRREEAHMPRETPGERQARELAWGITGNGPVSEQLPELAGSGADISARQMDEETL